MTQPGAPPTPPGSGRSIYERLGLTPAPNIPAPRRPAPIPPPRPRRATTRSLVAFLIIISSLAVIILCLPIGTGDHRQAIAPSASSEDERRMDSQDGQIKNLQMQVEVLEMKVRALQAESGYQGVDEERALLHAGTNKPSSRTERPVAH